MQDLTNVLVQESVNFPLSNSPRSQEGGKIEEKDAKERETTTACKCGEEFTRENKADNGSRSLCRVCEIMDKLEVSDASATKVASLCRTYQSWRLPTGSDS